MAEEQVILIDETDREIGSEEKITAHEKGVRHRAFSVFIFSSAGKLMLQKRADGKYHSAGLWTNTCCGHPRPGEETQDAAKRRLQEEMGFSCDLKEVFLFAYRTELENGLTENEIDHVFFGEHNDAPRADPLEASDWKWVSREELELDVHSSPKRYTYWLSCCFSKIKSAWPDVKRMTL